MTTQVLRCGGVVIYQLLCGREIARGDKFASEMKNYVYLVINTHDRTAIAVDAAWDIDGIYALAEKLGVRVKGCVYTHFHFDHCGGDVHPSMTGGRKVNLPGALEVERRGGKIWAGKDDAEMIKAQCHLTSIAPLDDGDVLDCGDLVLHTLRTPGHSPGSICVFAEPQCLSPRGDLGPSPFRETTTNADSGLLITGDTLFVGACGRTDLPGADPRAMMSSLARIATMDPAIVVLPGHGYSGAFTTVGEERSSNDMMVQACKVTPLPLCGSLSLPPCLACAGMGPIGPSGFVMGRKVKIAGLSSAAGQALNGQDGVVQQFDEGKGRYQVRLLNASEVKVLKPENLEASGSAEAASKEEEE